MYSIFVWYTWNLVCNLALACLWSHITQVIPTSLVLLLQVVHSPPPPKYVKNIMCVSLKQDLSNICYKSYNFEPICSKFCMYVWVDILINPLKRYVYVIISTGAVRPLIPSPQFLNILILHCISGIQYHIYMNMFTVVDVYEAYLT